ncbi:hypothetical protein CEXT_43541 [Caerostris extrusa]|uniref:Uncharacterized protein n=1 Tax=Caerostris extrusa TaxID=172846 RepID=A0AAV4P688_CAEEX|nr:hypothetical protein CEXT_43541 [Caerostris extrusa]
MPCQRGKSKHAIMPESSHLAEGENIEQSILSEKKTARKSSKKNGSSTPEIPFQQLIRSVQCVNDTGLEKQTLLPIISVL